ncbi:stage III sporulation protein AA [Salibacterium salarium]|uniref:Stage III sporulation protein AA n=1 Tax=Salibacterium salarium TaxID=284579 RepID=A0A428N843_9BACI|nr:stage III sporulation protein AA [Salibacterium salarium]RSL34554.1 stage III sporulation protein AA [Salibacterium salarium]
MDNVLALLPKKIQALFLALPKKYRIEEIRLRIYKPIEVVTANHFFFLEGQDEQSYVMTEEDMEYILNQLSEFSIYAFQEEMKQGYITTRGGHRVGIGGQVVHEQGKVVSIKHIRFFNIRIANDFQGTAAPYLDKLLDTRYGHTLIIGSPQSGKTTFLRDLARSASEGVAAFDIPSRKVGIVDERSELAACYQGIPSFEVGTRTDVLDACPKAEGMMMMIRSMSPEVIVADEVGRKEDVEAIMEAVHAGVTIFCTVHGVSYEDVIKRPMIGELLTSPIFKNIILLERQHDYINVTLENIQSVS